MKERRLLKGAVGVQADGLELVQDPLPEADARLRRGDIGRLLPYFIGKILKRVRELHRASVQRSRPSSRARPRPAPSCSLGQGGSLPGLSAGRRLREVF